MPPPAKSQAIDMPILWQPRDHDSAQVDTNSSSTSSSKETSRMDKTHCSHNRPSGQDRRRSHSRSSRQDRSRSYNRPSGKGRNRYRNLPDDKDQTSRESSPASSASSKQSVLLGSSSQVQYAAVRVELLLVLPLHTASQEYPICSAREDLQVANLESHYRR